MNKPQLKLEDIDLERTVEQSLIHPEHVSDDLSVLLQELKIENENAHDVLFNFTYNYIKTIAATFIRSIDAVCSHELGSIIDALPDNYEFEDTEQE